MGNLEKNPLPEAIFNFAAWLKKQITEDLEERREVGWANYSAEQLSFELPETEGDNNGTTD